MIGYKEAIWTPSPNFGRLGDASHKKWIVNHETDGSAQGTIAEFQQATSQKSAHYLVDRQGTIYQFVDEAGVEGSAWGNGILDPGCDPWWQMLDNPNNYTISIENENTDPVHQGLTPVQIASSLRLNWDISQRWHIPWRWADASGGITGHFSLEPINRHNCPGPLFPWAELFAYRGDTQPMAIIPHGWTDDGKILTAPNGVKVLAGFRQHVLQGWSPLNIPLQGEEGRDPVEESNPGLGKGTQQIFEWTTLEWTVARGVFEAWTGQELLKVRKERDALRTTPAPPNLQIKALEQEVVSLQGKLQEIGKVLAL